VEEGATVIDPERATAPIPWSISHDVALEHSQLKTEVAPAVIELGEASNVTVGAGNFTRKTSAVAVPPGPTAIIRYVVEASKSSYHEIVPLGGNGSSDPSNRQ
jgi:hypothetical protein